LSNANEYGVKRSCRIEGRGMIGTAYLIDDKAATQVGKPSNINTVKGERPPASKFYYRCLIKNILFIRRAIAAISSNLWDALTPIVLHLVPPLLPTLSSPSGKEL
jgi:hypothetical protein